MVEENFSQARFKPQEIGHELQGPIAAEKEPFITSRVQGHEHESAGLL